MEKTLRLVMPEWQGGDYDLSVGTGELYPLGARLLAFLAPGDNSQTIEVPIESYNPDKKRIKENGVVNQEIVIRQMKAAWAILEEQKPDRVITFGGDCLVSQAPFDYLNGYYKGDLGLLWIDAHPDVSTPANHDREHAMVLGNLLGHGDPIMSREVKNPFNPAQVLLVGQDNFDSPMEVDTINSLGLKVIKPQEVSENSNAVVNWLKISNISNLAVHLDLDVLNPKRFFSQLTNDPYTQEPYNTVKGQLDLRQIGRLFKDISASSNMAGLTIAEFMPWDDLHLQEFMKELKIFA